MALTKQASPQIRTLIYQYNNKWLPNVIPIEQIPKIYEEIQRLPTLYIFKNTKNNWWSEFISRRNSLLFYTQFYLALRPGEAIAIKKTDIWRVPSGKMYIKIRGENNKTKKSRILKIPKELEILIIKYLEDFPYESIWFFPSFRKRIEDNHISRYQWGYIFQRAMRNLNLWRPNPNTPRRSIFTPHSLRHTRAVDLLEKSNFDIWSVANILGHGRIDVTAAYLHACPSILRYWDELMDR